MYKIWSDCCKNKWPEVVGKKPDGFDNLIDEKRWHHIFANRTKQDYLHPIGLAARSLISEDFLKEKSKEDFENWESEEYSRRNEAERIIFLCYRAFGDLKWREKKAISEYCSKYSG